MRARFDNRRRMGQMSGSGPRDALRRFFTAPWRSAATTLVVAAMAGSALSARVYAAPPTSNEIRVGVTAPLTGPASAYGVIAKVMAAYADKVNAEGGINGRKLNLITYDDAYDPNKALEMTRKLVEEDQVLFTMATVGTTMLCSALDPSIDHLGVHHVDQQTNLCSFVLIVQRHIQVTATSMR